MVVELHAGGCGPLDERVFDVFRGLHRSPMPETVPPVSGVARGLAKAKAPLKENKFSRYYFHGFF